MVIGADLDRVEVARRLSGLSFAALSERTGISYKRLHGFFKADGRLSRQEMTRLEAVLMPEHPTFANGAASGQTLGSEVAS